MSLRYSFHGLGELMARHGQLFWCGRLSILLPDHQLLPELTHLPTRMPVGVVEGKTMIAETIVGAAEAMELCTSTPKTKVRFVGRMSSRICRAIVVVLILTVRIVNG